VAANLPAELAAVPAQTLDFLVSCGSRKRWRTKTIHKFLLLPHNNLGFDERHEVGLKVLISKKKNFR
jgi:hypothetical protein